MIQATNLNAHYGLSHVLQGVSLTLKNKNIFALIGRNGMGKTTFCNTIMGLVPITSGDIKINKSSINGLRTDQITHLGVGYVPQGRRIWPSLTVNEHLKLVERKTGAWNREKIYTTFIDFYIPTGYRNKSHNRITKCCFTHPISSNKSKYIFIFQG